MPEEKETAERRALRELVESIRNNIEVDVNRATGAKSTCVYLDSPELVSAMREAEAVLGVKVSK